MKEETREGESRVEKKWTLHSGAAQIFLSSDAEVCCGGGLATGC